MKEWFVKWGVVRSGVLRVIALMSVLLVVAALAIQALEYGEGPEIYKPTYYNYNTHENIIHIDVCDDGNVRVSPYTKNYLVEENYYGNFMVSIQLEMEVDEIVFSLPYGWNYHLLGGYKDYNASNYYEGYYSYPNRYYDVNHYNYVIIELVPPTSYNNYILDYDYINYISYDYTPEGGYINYAPEYVDTLPELDGDIAYDYTTEGGYINYAPEYIGIVPALGGNIVTFVPNGGAFLGGLPNVQLTTGLDGTVDSWEFATQLVSPFWDGRGFFWWSRSPDGRYNPAGGNDVDNFADRFDCSTVVTEDITLYAVWSVEARFLGQGAFLYNSHPDFDNVSDPTNPNQYGPRVIPIGWSINEAIAFGIYPIRAGWDPNEAYGPYIAMPNDPTRGGAQFWGWFNIPIPIDSTAPHPGEIDGDTPLYSAAYFNARWILHHHLVMFDMNHANASLLPGTAAQPARLYRWAIHGRSIADSGLGGGEHTGIGAHTPIGINVTQRALDGYPWTTLGTGPVPPEVERRNRMRTWIPNALPGNPGHLDRDNPAFTTPYYPGSGLVIGIGAPGSQAGTLHPRSAPMVRRMQGGEQWIPEIPQPLPGAGLSTNVMRDKYTLEGWWTTPDGWRDNNGSNIDSRRFAPPAHNSPAHNTHTAESFRDDHSAGNNARPEGFPRGLARTVDDSPYPANHPNHIDNPPTGIVTEDMTVYANWVYRVTFLLNGGSSHGPQGFSVAGNSQFNPGSNMLAGGRDTNEVNFRDILPCTSDGLRNINDSGQRVRANAGSFGGNSYVAHQVVQAGFPPYTSPSKPGHGFNGWWDRPIPAVMGNHYQDCPLCDTMFDYPANHHGAQRIEGHTQINGSLTAYAHWWEMFGSTHFYIHFHLNSDLIASGPETEGLYGHAYWPTAAPYLPGDTYTNPDNRFFLSRFGSNVAANNGMFYYNINIPGPRRVERNFRYSQVDLAFANVEYEHRYNEIIRRRFIPDLSIVAQPANTLPAGYNDFVTYRRFPRNPRRAGYVFVGWSLQQGTQALLPDGTPTPVVGGSAATNTTVPLQPYRIWPHNRPLTEIDGFEHQQHVYFFAIWAPAIELFYDGNDNTGPTIPTSNISGATQGSGGTLRLTNTDDYTPGEVRSEFVRLMPIGFSHHDLRYVYQARWGPPQMGNNWVGSGSMYNLDSSQVSRLYTRDNHIRLIDTVDTFNTRVDGRGEVITSPTRFTEEFFYANGGVYDPTNPSWPRYMRIYVQWGGRLVFHANHFDTPGHTPIRDAIIASEQSVNQAINTDTRNLNTPNVEDIWIHVGWQGTTGFLGTRGGWPRDPRAENPSRNFDQYGGDWLAMFQEPQSRAFVGWHRYVYPNTTDVPQALRGMPRACPSCRAGGPCLHYRYVDVEGDGVLVRIEQDYWVTENTPIVGHTDIFAIWSEAVVFNPGRGGDDVEMWHLLYNSTLVPGVGSPAGAPDAILQPGNRVERPVPNASFAPPMADPVWGGREFMGWFDVPVFDPAGARPPSLRSTGCTCTHQQPPIPCANPLCPCYPSECIPDTIVNTARRFYAVFGIMVRFRPWGPADFLAAGGHMNHQGIPTPIGGCPGYYIRMQIAGANLFTPHYEQVAANEWIPYRRPIRPGTADLPAWDNDQFSGEWFRFIRNPDCPVYDPTFDFIGPYCGDLDCCDPFDPANRERFVVRCDATGRAPYNYVWDNMTVYGLWHSRVTFRPGHVRGLLTDGGIASNNEVMRTVAEGLTLNNDNEPGQRTPPVSYLHARGSGWSNDPGLRFLGWRKVDFEGYPVVYENRNVRRVADGESLPDLWTTDEVNNMRASLPHHFFEAVWQLQLDFHKVTAANPDHPLGYDPLPGARFVLERYMYIPGDGYSWGRVYPPVSSDPEAPTFVTSDNFGRVAIGFTLAPGLELPQKANWPDCGTLGCYDNNLSCCERPIFRLVELLAPEGYMTPAGYWPVVISRYVGVRPDFNLSSCFPLPFEEYLEFRYAHITEEGPWEGIRQFVRNLPYDFSFWKTDSSGEKLPGAHIRLYVYTGDVSPPIELITQSMIDNGDWILAGVGISTVDDPLVFTMLPGRYYQFIETLPPVGFQVPMGQWRVTVDSAFPATEFPVLDITPVGDLAIPDIARMPDPDNEGMYITQTYLIYNWSDFILPLAGGGGMNMFLIFVGTTLLLLATGLAVWVKFNRNKISYSKMRTS